MRVLDNKHCARLMLNYSCVPGKITMLHNSPIEHLLLFPFGYSRQVGRGKFDVAAEKD